MPSEIKVPLVWTECKRTEAQAVYCLNCEKIIADCNSLFPLANVKGLHERGTRHSALYVHLAPA